MHEEQPVRWWVIGPTPFRQGAGRWTQLAVSWSRTDDVRYVHPTSVMELVRRRAPADLGVWVRTSNRLQHTTRVGYGLPAFPRLWRVPGVWRANEWAFGRWLRRTLRLARSESTREVIVDFCWPLSWSLAEAGADLLVYDCSDNFRAYPREVEARVDWAEERLVRLSQVVVASSSSFVQRLSQWHPDVQHITNGVSAAMLQELSGRVGAGQPAAKARTVLYHGATQDWRFDWELWVGTANLCPDLTFRVITDLAHVPRSLVLPANLVISPWLEGVELSTAIASAALGFMPYVLKEPTLSSMPLKLFEYFAAGLPVVATGLREIGVFSEHVAICEANPAEAARLIRQQIERDSEALRRRRRAVAEAHSWPRLAGDYRCLVVSRLQ